MRSRRAARATLIVAAGVLLGACGTAPRPQTLDHEADLAKPVEKLTRLHDSNAADRTRLAASCGLLTAWVQEYLAPSPAPLELSDVQCHWRAGRRGGAPEIVLGIVPDGTYRFHETEKLLDDERRVGGVGTDAIYDPQTRTVFCIRTGRLWYVQMVGAWAPKYNPQVVTSTLALRLMNQTETA